MQVCQSLPQTFIFRFNSSWKPSTSKDISTMLELLNSMGSDICLEENGMLTIDSSNLTNPNKI